MISLHDTWYPWKGENWLLKSELSRSDYKRNISLFTYSIPHASYYISFKLKILNVQICLKTKQNQV